MNLPVRPIVLPRALALPMLCCAALLPSCGGGGGVAGVGPGPSGARLAETVVFVAADGLQLLAARDDGSRPAEVLSDTVFTAIRQFELSPDGGAVAWIADSDVADRFDLYVRELGAAAPVRVSQLENAFNDVFDFAWAPDGQSLAYRADGVLDDTAQLFRAGRDGGMHYRIYFSGLAAIGVDAAYTWSPDSRYVALRMQQVGPTFELRLHDATTDAPGAPSLWFTEPGREVRDVAFAPDSAWIAFRSDTHRATPSGPALCPVVQPGEFQVFRRALATAPTTPGGVWSNGATAGSVQIHEFAWSPDGRSMAQRVVARLGGDDVGVNLYTLATGSSRRLIDTAAFSGMQWAPQANRLLLRAGYDPIAGATPALHLLAYDADTDVLSTISHPFAAGERLDAEQVAWAPDGLHVAYATRSTGFGGAIYLTQAMPSPQIAAATGLLGLEVFALAWSPDSSRLGVLELDQTQPFHPGTWHLLDAAGQSTWSSGPVFTFDTSRRMTWASDGARAAYSIAPPGRVDDLLQSASVQGGAAAVTLSATPAAKDQPFAHSGTSLDR